MLRRKAAAPSAGAWLVALVSFILPWAGIALIVTGAWRLAHEGRAEIWIFALGLALIVADVIIDFVWAHPTLSPTDEPSLNRRGAELIGRTFRLSEPIAGGRGMARCDDTVWQVEGPDLPAGRQVRVTGINGMLLSVEPLPKREEEPEKPMPRTDVVITREDGPAGGRYVARVPGIDAEAELTFRSRPSGAVVAAHTGVPDVFRGQGLGRLLVTRLVEDARKEGFKIIPACSYVDAERRKHPEWADVFGG